MTLDELAPPEILLMEDDAILGEELAETFERHGFTAAISSSWQAAIERLEVSQPDLILLDQHLGQTDTLLMLPRLRVLTAAPVLFLTGNRNEADRIIGLELGADDFLLKPIGGRELVARVRAHLRRVHRPPAEVGGEWRLLETERRVLRPDGEPVPLTAAEFNLLSYLAARPGEAVDRDRLTEQVLRRPYRAEDRSLDKLVHQIRRKIGRGSRGEVIAGVRSQGYVFSGFPKG
ncbi:MAG: response regulator transcription factor [Roseococcus sp.]